MSKKTNKKHASVMVGKGKTVDIEDPATFEHFIDCPHCGWSFDPEFFPTHDCGAMNAPQSNDLPHIPTGETQYLTKKGSR